MNEFVTWLVNTLAALGFVVGTFMFLTAWAFWLGEEEDSTEIIGWSIFTSCGCFLLWYTLWGSV